MTHVLGKLRVSAESDAEVPEDAGKEGRCVFSPKKPAGSLILE